MSWSPSRLVTAWLLVGTAYLAAVYFYSGSAGDADGQGRRHPAVGKKPALVKLDPLTEDAGSVTQDSLAGKVAVLNFWALWCPPCREELPLLADYAYRQRELKELAVLPIVYDQVPDDTHDWLAASTPKLYKKLGVSVPSYFDPQAATRQALLDVLGPEADVFPTTVVLDKRGTIRAVYLGYSPADFAAMKTLVGELLAEK